MQKDGSTAAALRTRRRRSQAASKKTEASCVIMVRPRRST